MSSTSRRDWGLFQVSKVTRWAAAGAVVATAGISALVASAQPGRSSSASAQPDDTTLDSGTPVTTLPAAATTPVAPNGRTRTSPTTTPRPAAPAPRHRRTTPTTTTSGS